MSLFFLALNLTFFNRETDHVHFLKIRISFSLGAAVAEDAAYPKEAVKSFHEKPQPAHEKGSNQKPKIIQQPRK